MTEISPENLSQSVNTHSMRARSAFFTDEEYRAWWFARLREKSITTQKGCWEWQGHVDWKGYGCTTYRGVTSRIHRKVYLLRTGIVLKKGEFVCHRCDVRRCWNWDHLFIGTAKVNNTDCAHKGRHHNTVKTHCKFGHPYDETNTEMKLLETGSVARECKTCVKIRQKSEKYVQWRRAYQRKRRQEAKARRQSL